MCLFPIWFKQLPPYFDSMDLSRINYGQSLDLKDCNHLTVFLTYPRANPHNKLPKLISFRAEFSWYTWLGNLNSLFLSSLSIRTTICFFLNLSTYYLLTVICTSNSEYLKLNTPCHFLPWTCSFLIHDSSSHQSGLF